MVRGMKSYPRKEDRERGIVPVEHLKEIEYALCSKNVRNTLSENEIDRKRIDLAKAILNLPIEEAKQIINTFRGHPEKEVNTDILGETSKRKTHLALKTETESSKQFKDSKSIYDVFVKGYKESIETLEDEAKINSYLRRRSNFETKSRAL